MNRLEFETRLFNTYNGAVKPLTSYVNKHAVLCFKCSDCGLVFFGKPSHLVGKDHQRHSCNMPYGDVNGQRDGSGVRGKYTPKRRSKKNKGDRFSQMVWEDYTPQEIAKELDIPYKMVLEYFKDEGLI